jgi:hypothetical protein
MISMKTILSLLLLATVSANAALYGVKTADGTGWFKRTFQLDPKDPAQFWAVNETPAPAGFTAGQYYFTGTNIIRDFTPIPPLVPKDVLPSLRAKLDEVNARDVVYNTKSYASDASTKGELAFLIQASQPLANVWWHESDGTLSKLTREDLVAIRDLIFTTEQTNTQAAQALQKSIKQGTLDQTNWVSAIAAFGN